MENDKKCQEAIDRLTSSTDKWTAVKKILLEDIQATHEVIEYIDRIIQERHDKFAKLN